MPHSNVFMRDSQLGNIYLPSKLSGMTSYPDGHIRHAIREIGIFVAKQRRPIYAEDGTILRYETIWASVTHNERVDKGADLQAQQLFSGGAGPTAVSATLLPTVIAIANGTLTKTKTDLSLGSASANVTTNEITTVGLARVASQAVVAGDYTLPGSLGGTFTQNIKKTMTASGSITAYGAGLFDSVTVSGSRLFVEDNYASTAVMVSGDTLATTIGITN